MIAIERNSMQASSIPNRTVKQLFQPARVAINGTFSLIGLLRMLRPGRLLTTKDEQPGDAAMLSDAHGSMRCGNHARSWRLLSEWLRSRGDQPADYGWLSARIIDWEDERVIARLTQARISRLLALRRPTEALHVLAQRLTVDPHFRPLSAADTLMLAQIAARGGALQISRRLLSDFSGRFAGDPRVAVSEALKRRLAEPAPVGMRA